MLRVRLPPWSRVLLAFAAVGAGTLLFDEVPVDVTWKAHFFRRLSRLSLLKWLESFHRSVVQPACVATAAAAVAAPWILSPATAQKQQRVLAALPAALAARLRALWPWVAKAVVYLAGAGAGAGAGIAGVLRGSNLLLAVFALFLSRVAARFLWRVRDNAGPFFSADNAAYIRDIIQYREPWTVRASVAPLVWAEKVLYNPVMVGMERVAPYTGWLRPPGAGDGAGVIGAVSLHADGRPYTAEELAAYRAAPRIPAGSRRPLMFVGNHCTLGADMVLMHYCLGSSLDLYLRGLAHRGHFNFPLWSDTLRWLGAFPGTREACGELLSRGCALLVYPGGGREVMKKTTDPPYQLMWGSRAGFAALAVEAGAVIIPVAAVGVNESLPVVGDFSFEAIYGRYEKAGAGAGAGAAKRVGAGDGADTLRAVLDKAELEIASPTSSAGAGAGAGAGRRSYKEPSTPLVHPWPPAPLTTTSTTTTTTTSTSEPDPQYDGSAVTAPIVMPPVLPQLWQRWYFKLGRPVDAALYYDKTGRPVGDNTAPTTSTTTSTSTTSASGGISSSAPCALHIKSLAHAALTEAITELQALQRADPDRYTLTRWGRRVRAAVTGLWRGVADGPPKQEVGAGAGAGVGCSVLRRASVTTLMGVGDDSNGAGGGAGLLPMSPSSYITPTGAAAAAFSAAAVGAGAGAGKSAFQPILKATKEEEENDDVDEDQRGVRVEGDDGEARERNDRDAATSAAV